MDVKVKIKNFLRKSGFSVVKGKILPVRKNILEKVAGFAPYFKDLPPGAVVECGVGWAESFLALAYLSERYGQRLYGYDSFEGFPEPTVEDVSPRNPQKGQWKVVEVSDVFRFLKTAKFSDEWITKNVTVVKGFFEDTLKTYDGCPIAFLHLDVDIYKSYKDCLSYLAPHVVRGGYIFFDEYKHPKWPGATQAIDEFINEGGYTLQHDEFLNRYYIRILNAGSQES